MQMPSIVSRRPLLLLGGALLSITGVLLVSSMMTHAAIFVPVGNGVAEVRLDETQRPPFNAFELDVVYGTEVLPEDRAKAEEGSAPFDESAFLDHLDEVVDEQRRQRDLLDFNGDERIKRAELDRAEEAAAFGEDEIERERVRQLFRDQPEPTAQPRNIDLALDDAEQERVRRLFQDSGSVRNNGDPETGIDDAERERIRQLFRDQGDAEPVAVGTDVPRRDPGPAGCARRRTLLAIIPQDLLFCGNDGVAVGDTLIGPDCPISACILKFGPASGPYDDLLSAG